MDQLKYEIDIFWSEEDGGYIANVPDLKYCSAFGETYEEALQEAQEAIDLHLEVMRELGRTVPEPRVTRPEESKPYPKAKAPQSPGNIGEVHEAAQQFADAVRESYQTVVEHRAVAARELNAELTQSFFDSVITNLRTQVDQNREMTQQQEHQREDLQALARVSTAAYMDFINSMFSYYQGALREAKPGAEGRR